MAKMLHFYHLSQSVLLSSYWIRALHNHHVLAIRLQLMLHTSRWCWNDFLKPRLGKLLVLKLCRPYVRLVQCNLCWTALQPCTVLFCVQTLRLMRLTEGLLKSSGQRYHSAGDMIASFFFQFHFFAWWSFSFVKFELLKWHSNVINNDCL